MSLAASLALAMGPTPEGYGTGLEWMLTASILVPLLLLLIIIWYGSHNDV